MTISYTATPEVLAITNTPAALYSVRCVMCKRQIVEGSMAPAESAYAYGLVCPPCWVEYIDPVIKKVKGDKDNLDE